MTFHHIDPTKKEKKATKAVLQEDYDELNKCCLLCGNCHYLISSKEIIANFSLRSDGKGYVLLWWAWNFHSPFYDGQRYPGICFQEVGKSEVE